MVTINGAATVSPTAAGRLANGTVAVPPDLQALIDAALNQLGLSNAGYDAEQEATQRNYNTTLQDLIQGRTKALGSQAQNLSDHGLLNSGIALQGYTDTNQQYDRANSDAGSNETATLSDLARKRLLANQTYEQTRAQYLSQATDRQATLDQTQALQDQQLALNSTPVSVSPADAVLNPAPAVHQTTIAAAPYVAPVVTPQIQAAATNALSGAASTVGTKAKSTSAAPKVIVAKAPTVFGVQTSALKKVLNPAKGNF